MRRSSRRVASLRPEFDMGGSITDEHYHSKLVSPDGLIDPAIAINNDGDFDSYNLYDINLEASHQFNVDAPGIYLDAGQDGSIGITAYSGGDIWIDSYPDGELLLDAEDLTIWATRTWYELDVLFTYPVGMWDDLEVVGHISAWGGICGGNPYQHGVHTNVWDDYHYPLTCVGNAQILPEDWGDDSSFGPNLMPTNNAARGDEGNAESTDGWEITDQYEVGGAYLLPVPAGGSSWRLEFHQTGPYQRATYAIPTEIGKHYKFDISVWSPLEYYNGQDIDIGLGGCSVYYDQSFTSFDYIMEFYVTAEETTATIVVMHWGTGWEEHVPITIMYCSLREVLPGGTGRGNLEIWGSLALMESEVAITAFSTDGTLSGNSDAAVPTEKAVATAIAAAIGVHNAHQHAHVVMLGGALSLAGSPATNFEGTYKLSLAGALTFLGSPSPNFEGKLEETFAGAVTLAGDLVANFEGTYHTALAGAFAPTGTSVRLKEFTQQALSGELTLVGVATKLSAALPMAGGLVPTGVESRMAKKVLAGAVTLAGVAAGKGKKVLAGAVTLAGVAAGKGKKALAGALALAGISGGVKNPP